MAELFSVQKISLIETNTAIVRIRCIEELRKPDLLLFEPTASSALLKSHEKIENQEGADNMENPKKTNLDAGAGMGAGIAIGVALGLAMGNIAIGLAIGVAFGAAFANESKKKRKK